MAEGSPVARWQVRYPNGQVTLYLNEEQARKDAARKGVTATQYIPPGFPDDA